jgi:hypothetical protein
VPLSFHSDLPMGPSDPLAMASFAVNRVTHAGRVAGPEHRISVQAALEAVTIGAAHSWRREHDLGSIEVGKIANFTVLADDPFEIDPRDLGRIVVRGSVFEGVWFEVPAEMQATRVAGSSLLRSTANGGAHSSWCEHGCSCEVARFIADHVGAARLAA